jgi:hypothetical protein
MEANQRRTGEKEGGLTDPNDRIKRQELQAEVGGNGSKENTGMHNSRQRRRRSLVSTRSSGERLKS